MCIFKVSDVFRAPYMAIFSLENRARRLDELYRFWQNSPTRPKEKQKANFEKYNFADLYTAIREIKAF